MLMSKSEALIYIWGILEERWFLTRDSEVSRLGSEVSPVDRKGKDILITGDPAGWGDWEEAVNKITNAETINHIQAKKALIELMKKYNTEGFHLQETIDHFQNVLINPAAWENY